MPNEEIAKKMDQFADIQKYLATVIENLRPLLPSVRIECPAVSPQPIEVYLGKWNGTKWEQTFLKKVNPGETFSQKLVPIAEFSDFKKGDSLMIRVKKDVAIYNLKNLETYFGYALTVTPAVYPWWPPAATAVRWGPSNPYIVQPSATIYSYVTPDWEDVFYYYSIG
jgi:hypothetical protein